jgi:hypothetical protein
VNVLMKLRIGRIFWPILLLAVIAAFQVHALSAHTAGGIARLIRSEIGSYWVYAWTAPEPLRVGMAHISVAVTQPGSDDRPEEAVADATVRVALLGTESGQRFEVETVPEVRLETVYYEADIRLPTEGRWQTTVSVEGPLGSGSVEFPMDVLPARSQNWTFVVGGASLLVIVVAVMAVWMHMSTSAKTPSGKSGRKSR